MFTDGRSKRVIFVAHCILNQNAISDGTANFPGTHKSVVQALLDDDVGVVQLPCPEVSCLGLDRGDPAGASRPVTAENTRIRWAMEQPERSEKLASLVEYTMTQIREYRKHGFAVLGIVGMNRSPCCGVETTSDQDQEVEGRGVFMAALQKALAEEGINIPFLGIKGTPDAPDRVRTLL